MSSNSNVSPTDGQRSFRRLGFVIPAANTTLEVEAPLVLKETASSHFQRFGQLVRSQDDLAPAQDAIVAAAQVLVSARIAALGIGYTAGSYAGGTTWDGNLRARVSDAIGRPAITAADAIIRCLRTVGAARVAVVSPYSRQVNDGLRAYLDASGIGTTALVGSPPRGPAGEVPIPEVEQLALSVDRAGAHALLIACTGLRTMTLIEALERRTGLPVVSSNLALLVTLLDSVGPRPTIPRYGSLLGQPENGAARS